MIKMVLYYQNIFGKNNVLVYLYEEVFDSPEGMQKFLKDIGLELKGYQIIVYLKQ